MTETELKPIVEALIYLAEEPLTEATLVALLGKEHKDLIRVIVPQLIQEYQSSGHGVEVKEVANGYKMATKAEYHEWVRQFIKHQTPPTKLSLAALETLAVIGYKQPITIPEIQEIRGVNAAGVLKTLIEKNLVTTAGRKNVIGRPILYKTTKEFLVHFGLKNLDELPSLEEFEELAQSAFGSGSEASLGAAQAEASPANNSSQPSTGENVTHPERTCTSEENVSAESPSSPESTPEESQTEETADHFAQSK
jgi:segregation and condensation protein B